MLYFKLFSQQHLHQHFQHISDQRLLSQQFCNQHLEKQHFSVLLCNKQHRHVKHTSASSACTNSSTTSMSIALRTTTSTTTSPPSSPSANTTNAGSKRMSASSTTADSWHLGTAAVEALILAYEASQHQPAHTSTAHTHSTKAGRSPAQKATSIGFATYQTHFITTITTLTQGSNLDPCFHVQAQHSNTWSQNLHQFIITCVDP